jgi:hypothetical protein
VLLKENQLGYAPSLQNYLVLQGFAALSNTSNFYFLRFSGRHNVLKRNQDGVPLNAQHHNTKPIPTI